MATTSNYGWTTPNDSDPFKDGALAIRTLGTAVDSTLYTINNGSTKVGLHLITSGTLSGGSVTISSAFSSTYDSYEIVLSNMISSAPQATAFRLGTTTSGYYGSVFLSGSAYSTASGNVTFTNQSNASQLETGIVSSNTTSTTSGGVITVQNPFLTTSTTIQSRGSDPRTDGQGRMGTGAHLSATSFTSFTILTSSGTFSGGTIRVYGLRNS